MRWSVFTTSLSRSQYWSGAELELRRPPPHEHALLHMASSINNSMRHAGSLETARYPSPEADFVAHVPPLPDPVPKRPLVYLLSIYPAVSHTFFLNEVRELRRQGFTVEVASINQPDIQPSSMHEAEAEEMAGTFYVKSSGAAWALWIATKTLLRRPVVFIRGLRAALRLGRGNLFAMSMDFSILQKP